MDTLPGVRPHFRTNDLVVNSSGHELLVYDHQTNHLHQLDPISAATWRFCDGEHTLDAIVNLVRRDLGEAVSADFVLQALHQLSSVNLLRKPLDSAVVPLRQSRRALLRKAAIVGTLSAPVIVSISAPAAAHAASCPTGIPCGSLCCEPGEICGAPGGGGGGGGGGGNDACIPITCPEERVCGDLCCSPGEICGAGGGGGIGGGGGGGDGEDACITIIIIT